MRIARNTTIAGGLIQGKAPLFMSRLLIVMVISTEFIISTAAKKY